MVAFGLIWPDGLFDDTSSVLGWILVEVTNVLRIMNVAACFLL